MSLEKRLLKGNENLGEILKDKIDFSIVNENLKKFRDESKKFLKDALQGSIKE